MNTPTPAAQLRLSEFIETIEEAKKANPEFKTWDFRYWRLPAREAVFLMLTGQGDEESVKWRNTRPGDPRYCLKIFDEKGEYAPVGAEFLQQGGNLPESFFVRLEEVALQYLTQAGNGHCCICIPWRDTQGNLMLSREAAGLCKRVFIPYLTAKQMLEDRLHDVTAKEIALWLAYGNEGITTKDSEWANARDETFRFSLGIAETHPAAKTTTLEDLLNHLYFSEEELKTANPRRWRSYNWLKQWAADRGAEEADLLAIIKPCFLVLDSGKPWFGDGRISDPTPVSAALKETLEDLARRAMYREDWIQAVNEDKFPDREAKQSLLAEKAAKQKAELLTEVAEKAQSTYTKREALIEQLAAYVVDIEKFKTMLDNATGDRYKWLQACKSPDKQAWDAAAVIYGLAHNTALLNKKTAEKFGDKALGQALEGRAKLKGKAVIIP